MRVFVVNTDGVEEITGPPDLARVRDNVRGWCNMPNAEIHTNWVALLDVLADTVELVGTDLSDDEAPLKAIEALTRDDMGTAFGLAAYLAATVGWQAPYVLRKYTELDSAVSGWIVGAIMVGANKSDVSVEVIWRVIDTLTPDERETVLAQTGAILHALGFTAHAVRGLRDTKPEE